MPRVTRATLRSNTESEQHTGASRRVFGEITGNSSTQPPNALALIELPLKAEVMPPKKTARKEKAKKGKGGKKAKKPVQNEAPHTIAPEVLDDDSQSSVSDAVNEAYENLKVEGSAKETYQIPMPDHDRPNTPPSRAAREATKQLSPKTPKFNPEVHTANGELKGQGLEKDDSFVENIDSRSAAKKVFTASEGQLKEDQEDSFIGQISSRSPAKATTRIEDSVAEIDALEDALEEIGQALPTVQDTESPVKTKKPPPGSSRTQEAPKGPSSAGIGKPVQANTKASRQHTGGRNPSTTRKASVAAIQAAAVATRAKNSITSHPVPAIERKTTRKCGLLETANLTLPKTKATSISKTPFQPTKSTKPPTKSTFELPGEAMSRRLKAQREERQKREEEEAQKRKEFKATSVRVSVVPVVKPTATSNARISLVQETAPDRIPVPSRTSSVGPISKRLSQLALPKRTPSSAVNTSAIRDSSLGNAKRIPSTIVPTASTGAKNVVTKEEAIQQKQRAKEIFGRDKAEKEEREREKKEKEDAAKKARAQAAERGRQASREWAEKQKARQMSLQAEKQKGANGAAAAVAAAGGE